MILIDTSIWVDVLRDTQGGKGQQLRAHVDDRDVALCRFTQLELLQGARTWEDWDLLDEYLEGQRYLEAVASTWRGAARLYFELRRRGLTVRSSIDCCIAQIAIEHDVPILHRDRDFQSLASVSTLAEQRLEWR